MKQYKIKKAITNGIAEKLESYPEFLRELLYFRGIFDKTTAEIFLNPDFKRDSNDPFLMPDIDDGILRVKKAFDEKEKICVFADYDHDGIPGAVIAQEFFKKAGHKNFFVYIPHRNKDGFGLQPEHIEDFKKKGVKLVITIDCGTTATGASAKANDLGVDLIITDHHSVGGKEPRCVAFINPKRDISKYPFRELCGSGVFFKFIEGFVYKTDHIENSWVEELLDLVAVATIGDLVPLLGENRLFVYEGLRKIRTGKRAGLKAIIDSAKINITHLSEDDVAFMIVPRINAPSRMDLPEDAFNLLSTASFTEAEKLAIKLNGLNEERKLAVARVVKKAKSHFDKKDNLSAVLVTGDISWEPGLLGLASSALSEHYNCPVYLWTVRFDGIVQGSCRGPKGVDVVSLMRDLGDGVFIDKGGHKEAGGFTMEKENLHFLEEKLNTAFLAKKIATEEGVVLIDKKCKLTDINWEDYSLIEMCSPFGARNPKPVFLFENVLVESVRYFGKTGDHLGIVLKDESVNKKVEAINFFNSLAIKNGERINLVATMEKSAFRGRPELRLRIVDIIF